MKTILLILLSLSLGFFAKAEEEKMEVCQDLSCLSEEQKDTLLKIAIPILGYHFGLTHNFTTQEDCPEGAVCLSKEQTDLLQSLFAPDYKKAESEKPLKQKTSKTLLK